jgi:hypothetical protein
MELTEEAFGAKEGWIVSESGTTTEGAIVMEYGVRGNAR